MNGNIKRALAGALVAAAFAPAAAQAEPVPSVSAVVTATVRADAHLDRVQQLAGSTRAAARRRALTLLRRSRAQLESAAAKTHAIVEHARTTAHAAAATQATAQLDAALEADAEGQITLAATANGKLASAATDALAADAAMKVDARADLGRLVQDGLVDTLVGLQVELHALLG